MAKKKHSTKKHTFKYAAPVGAVAESRASAYVTQQNQGKPSHVQASAAAIVATDGRDFSYVGHDLRRLMKFSVSLVAVELLLWLAVDYTPLGSSIYNLIKI